MLGSEDGTVSVDLEDGNVLGKPEAGGSLGKMLEDGRVLGSSLGTGVGTSLGKRLGLDAGTVFVSLEGSTMLGKTLVAVKARLSNTEDVCNLLGLKSGGM